MSVRCSHSKSAAKLFLQLSTRPNLGSQHHILEVLVPAQTRNFHQIRTTVRVPAEGQLRRRSGSPTNNLLARDALRRSFSSTIPRPKTQALLNPQKDDDGNDMLMEITPRAANRLSQIMTKDKNPHLALRVQVESGGCHGFQYLMSLTTLPSAIAAAHSSTVPDASIPNPPSEAAEAEITPSTTTSAAPFEGGVSEEDTIFAFVKDDADTSAAAGQGLAAGPKVVIDGPSLELLKGSKVDFVMELIGSQFKIVDNPAAVSGCGCGTSFDIKI